MDRDPIPLGELRACRAEGRRVLDLSSRGFGPLSALIAVKLIKDACPELTKLALDHNPMEAAGATAVAALLRDNRTLKEVHLRYTGVGMGGALTLADALNENSTLEKLFLVSNLIGSEGALAFEAVLSDGNASLKLLDLHHNRLSAQAKASMEALAARRPELQIEL